MYLKKIAEGLTAEVFRLEPGKVVKLYHEGYPSDEAIREAERCELAFKQGLPTPRIMDLTHINGRQGIVFDECQGTTMESRLRSHPTDIGSMAIMFAQCHAQIHDCSGFGLPTTHERTNMKIEKAQRLDDVTKNALHDKLSHLPTETHLCHGDFHPGNVLLTDNGPVLIDGVDATMGSPVADVVRTTILIRYSELPVDRDEAETFSQMKDAFLGNYLQKYATLKPLSEQSMVWWMPIVAGTRLSENATGPVQTNALLSLAGSVSD